METTKNNCTIPKNKGRETYKSITFLFIIADPFVFLVLGGFALVCVILNTKNKERAMYEKVE